jgi:hypothetical protein
MIRPRLHTSTLLVLLLSAATLLALNFSTRYESRPCPQSDVDMIYFGWPETFLYYGLPNNVVVPGANTEWSALRLNILIWLGILLALAIPAECIARRRFSFQIHLKTALILMLAASALVWANVRAVLMYQQVAAVNSLAQIKLIASETYAHGWPFTAATVQHTLDSVDTHASGEDLSESLELRPNPPVIQWPQATANLAIALAILVTLATLSEFITRRNQTKNAQTTSPPINAELTKNKTDGAV